MYEKICSNCGHKLSAFLDTGMLGCPQCYAQFEREISSVCKKIHGRNLHVGKSPKFIGVDKVLLEEYKKLTEDREKAGIDGDFSKMATLSEQILELKEELKQRGIM